MKIKDLKPGQKIKKAGLYRLPLEAHHAQPCDGISVTSSILRNMEIKTPMDVWAFHDLNPDAFEQTETRALIQGRAMAAFIEGGLDLLREQFKIADEAAPRRPTAQQLQAYAEGRATEAGKKSVEYWDGVTDETYLTATEAQNIIDMGIVLRSDEPARSALEGEAEITMAWHDTENDLWVLSRPDNIQLTGLVSDYKKMAASGRPFDTRLIDQRITAHGYYMQMALAVEAFGKILEVTPEQVGLVCQMSEAPHHVVLREIAAQEIELGHFRNRRARRRFRACLDAGYWPAPGEVIGAYQMPTWLKEDLYEQMAEAGEMPTPAAQS